MTTAPARPTPTRPTTPAKPTTPAAPAAKGFTVSNGPQQRGQRVILYGPEGSGKTTLASLIERSRFIDRDSDGTKGMHVSRVDGIDTFDDVISALSTPALWKDISTVIVDSGTVVQELATLAVVGVPKQGEAPKSLETVGGGYGKGYRMVYEKMLLFFAALDRHVEQGRNVVLICHSTTGNIPNPNGPDYLQHQLSLQQTSQGQLRTRAGGWADHVIFINRDVSVKEDTNKANATTGSRTLETVWSPWWVAKTRVFSVNGEERSLLPQIEYYDPRGEYAAHNTVLWQTLGFNK